MKFKVNVKTKFDLPKLVKNFYGNGFAEDLADMVKEEVLSSVARGVSPVRGYGRFPEYKGAGDSTKYPATVAHKYPDKKVRPVNLYLSGKMLGALRATVNITKLSLSFGYLRESKEKLKAETHNEGTQSPKVPQRKFIPTGDGEEFTIEIQRKIVDFFKRRMSDIIELSNKR